MVKSTSLLAGTNFAVWFTQLPGERQLADHLFVCQKAEFQRIFFRK